LAKTRAERATGNEQKAADGATQPAEAEADASTNGSPSPDSTTTGLTTSAPK
jgi:hypothetical protein